MQLGVPQMTFDELREMLESLGSGPIARGIYGTDCCTRINAIDLGEQITGRLEVELPSRAHTCTFHCGGHD
jgi:hypothetical protein